MAVAFVASSSKTSLSNTALQVDTPAGVQTNDLLLAVCLLYDVGGSWTLPSGWTTAYTGSYAGTDWAVVWRRATASEPTSHTFDQSGGTNAAKVVRMGAWRGADPAVAPDFATVATSSGGSATDSESTNSMTAVSDGMLVTLFGFRDREASGMAFTTPSGMTSRGLTKVLNGAVRAVFMADQQVVAGSIAARTTTASGSYVDPAEENDNTNVGWLAFAVVLAAGVAVPFAPTLTTPTGNQVVDRAEDLTLTFTHSTSDGGSQSDAEVRYRQTDVEPWTDITSIGSDGFTVVSGGTVAAGSYEWQGRTANADGTFGPWSASQFFVAASKPVQPVWVAPAAAGTITVPVYTATLSHSTSPDLLQIRVLLSGGSIVVDTTETWTTAPVITLPAVTNNVQVTLRARAKENGLWGNWRDVLVNIDYPVPPVPVVTVARYLSGGEPLGLRITHTIPTPVGDEVEVVSAEVWRRETGVDESGFVADNDDDFISGGTP